MKVLFLDESGDHNLSLIDPQYPIFVLGGVMVEHEYAEGALVEALNAFKMDMFGRQDLILHTADIARNRNGFERLKDAGFRHAFMVGLNALMSDLQYSVVACAIRKDAHLSRYGLAAVDPYLLSLDIVIERFCFEIGKAPSGGIVIAERRGATLDRELELAWLNLKIQGTRYVKRTTWPKGFPASICAGKATTSLDFSWPTLSFRRSAAICWARPTSRIGGSLKVNFVATSVAIRKATASSCFRNEMGPTPLRSDQPTLHRCGQAA